MYASLCGHCAAAPLSLQSGVATEAEPIDQVPIHKHGCGPVAQLNAYRFSSLEWRATTDKLEGSAHQQFSYLTRKYGRRISPYAYGHFRWNEKSGMRPRDLYDFINAFHRHAKLPKLAFSELFLKGEEEHLALAQRTRAAIEQSLANGFPPILSIARFAKISSAGGGFRWAQVSSHFVTILEMEPSDDASGNLNIVYIDPWGGRKLRGTIRVPTQTFYAVNVSQLHGKKMRKNPCLLADFPDSHVGIHQLANGTANALIAGQLIFAKTGPVVPEP